MISPDGFHVDPDDVGARAAAVGELVGRLDAAQGRAHPVNPMSYGLVGQFFAGGAQRAAEEARAAIGDLADATAAAARSARECQAAYIDVEVSIAARFRGVSW